MIKALALVVDEHKIIRPLENIKDIEIEYVIASDDFEFSVPYPDIILTVSDWRACIAKILLKAKEIKIPSIMFQDGSLDWIIQNEGDLYGGSGGATHFHPILTDKMAVMGFQSQRIISSWDKTNYKKTEVVGAPILQNQIDFCKNLRNQKNINRKKHKTTKNILITSTRQGWFSENQKYAVIHALKDLKRFFENIEDVNITWRLSRNLSKIIGVENQMKDKLSYELIPLIQESDYVISSQSTVVFEAMIHGKPVVIFDYLNVPRYYNTAWFINSKSQIAKVIESLFANEPSRLIFQEYTLNDVLLMNKNSIKMSEKLIKKMIDFRLKNDSIDFPENMLSISQHVGFIDHGYNEEDVFPAVSKNYEINKKDLIRLITRYSHENKLLRKKLKDKSFLEYLAKLKNKFFN
tara:strand:- start:7483 stop:8703 length:1221 start_codon:yes stop_codon:yes gene_type:complete